ncbi:MAG: DUF4349 domain-containing protein [Pseudoclavibacter sp.]|nr:DUF4349 domain-containing protein [Pseudoclavibacter sp.]
MKTPRSRIRVVAIGAALLAGLTACAAPPSASAPDQEHLAPEQAQQGAEAQTGPGGAVTADTARDGRTVVTSGVMTIANEDVAGTAGAAELAATELDGRIDRRDESGAGGGTARVELTIRVPADRYEDLLARLRELGEVHSLETLSEDVTLERTDLEARIRTLESSLEGLRGMLRQQGEIADLLEVEREITAREAELQSLRSQLEVLKDRSAMSTLDLSVVTWSAETPSPRPAGFLGGLRAGWEMLLYVLGTAATAFGFALPGLGVLAILLSTLWLLLRALRRRGARPTGPLPAAAVEMERPAAAQAPAGAEGAKRTAARSAAAPEPQSEPRSRPVVGEPEEGRPEEGHSDAPSGDGPPPR